MRKTLGSKRRGFTLVELLVVITIIGLLIAILVPAINIARVSAKNFAITAEVTQLSQGLEEYKNAFGDYPPNFNNGALLQRHLSKRQRLAPTQLTEFAKYVEGGSLPIDPAETIPFWLGAQSTNASLHNNPVVPLQTGAIASRTGEPKSFFGFDAGRLTDRDGDGWFEYTAPGSNGAPYVYFDGRSYANYTSNQVNIGTVNGQDRGSIKPFLAASPANSYVEPTKFQIISSGLDGMFGGGGVIYPNGPYAANDRDNIASFSEGRTFQDATP